MIQYVVNQYSTIVTRLALLRTFQSYQLSMEASRQIQPFRSRSFLAENPKCVRPNYGCDCHQALRRCPRGRSQGRIHIVHLRLWKVLPARHHLHTVSLFWPRPRHPVMVEYEKKSKIHREISHKQWPIVSIPLLRLYNQSYTIRTSIATILLINASLARLALCPYWPTMISRKVSGGLKTTTSCL